MKALNQKERSKAWQKVAGFFVFTFILAMVLGFVTMNVNRLTDTKTKTDLEKLQNEQQFQREVFAPNVAIATTNLAKVPVYREEGENIEVLNSNIAGVISQTMKDIRDDESWESKMYRDILKVYSELQQAYRNQNRLVDEQKALQAELNIAKLAGGSGVSENMARLERELEKTKKELNDCNQVNRVLRAENNRLKQGN
jgi:hypothetical protein